MIGPKLTAVALLASALLLSSCGEGLETVAAAETGGQSGPGQGTDQPVWLPVLPYDSRSAGRGRPGGPPLTRIASRIYIGGVLPNTPDNMSRWIQNPKQVDHLTAMPYLGVTPGDARDITGFLYTLK